MNELKIEYKKLSEIKPYERNNKKHPKSQIDKLRKQIEANGFDVPIVIDENNVIIKGHGRYICLKEMKAEKVPCIIRTDLTENQKKAARIADNKLSEIAEVDLDNLKFEMEELKNINFDVELTGFDDFSIVNEGTFEPNLPSNDDGNKETKNKFVVIITCENEDEQQSLFNELKDRGLKVKI